MTKAELFSLALDEFNIKPVTEDELNSGNGQRKEIPVLELHFEQAVSRVCIEFDWSWLNEIVEFSEESDKGAKAGYEHSYILPDTVSRVTNVPVKKYRIVGDILLTHDPVDFIIAQNWKKVSDFSNTLIPYEWWTVVSTCLAMLSISLVNNNQNTYNLLKDKYNTAIQSLAMMDAQHSSRRLVKDAF